MKTADESNDRSNKGILRIEQGENNSYRIVFEPEGSTVWLRKAELPFLFDVKVQAVNACLDAIIRENTVDVRETCRYNLYVSGNRIRYDVRDVRLEVVIAMAFRINSFHAKALREWFTGRCLHPGIDVSVPLSGTADFCLN
jgi:hypothetical protein